jgi:predicted metalloprotease with PDZ domain
MVNATVCYAESWAFCHFLMTYPNREEPTRQIPNGKYRPMISAFYESMLNKQATADAAWAAALKAGRVASIEALEKEWKAYVLDLAKPDPNSAYLGVQIDGKRVVDGVMVDTVAEGSPAEKAGVQSGDQIVKFDEKAVEFWNDFLARLRTKRPGETISLTVKRDEKELRLAVTLERRGEGKR